MAGKSREGKGQKYDVSELVDSALEDVSGGGELDISCPENTNCAGANCVAGCGKDVEQAT